MASRRMQLVVRPDTLRLLVFPQTLVPKWELLVSSKVTAGASRRFPELYKLVARLLEIATPLPASQRCSTGRSHNLRFDL